MLHLRGITYVQCTITKILALCTKKTQWRCNRLDTVPNICAWHGTTDGQAIQHCTGGKRWAKTHRSINFTWNNKQSLLIRPYFIVHCGLDVLHRGLSDSLEPRMSCSYWKLFDQTHFTARWNLSDRKYDGLRFLFSIESFQTTKQNKTELPACFKREPLVCM